MKPLLVKQKGAVLLEAVYVLPIMVFATLFIFESVNYALDTLTWNENIFTLHSEIHTDANQGDDQSFVSSSGLLQCVGTSVSPVGNWDALIKDRLFDWEYARSMHNFDKDDITVVTDVETNAVGETFYVLRVSYAASTVLFPEFEDLFNGLRIYGDTVFEVNTSCKP